jgi:protoheme ferro-lyase
MEKKNYGKIIILPLFPQYASASTGSAIDKAIKLISKWWIIPEIKIINQFYNDEGYLNTIIERAKKYNLDEYDHILFSYHGLPVRQVDKMELFVKNIIVKPRLMKPMSIVIKPHLMLQPGYLRINLRYRKIDTRFVFNRG